MSLLSAADWPASQLRRDCIKLGIDTLIVDRHEQMGDNWRKDAIR